MTTQTAQPQKTEFRLFRSIHILTGETLYERPPQSQAEFQTALSALRQRQRHFAAQPVTARTALLSAFAQRLVLSAAGWRAWSAKKSAAV